MSFTNLLGAAACLPGLLGCSLACTVGSKHQSELCLACGEQAPSTQAEVVLTVQILESMAPVTPTRYWQTLHTCLTHGRNCAEHPQRPQALLPDTYCDKSHQPNHELSAKVYVTQASLSLGRHNLPHMPVPVPSKQTTLSFAKTTAAGQDPTSMQSSCLPPCSKSSVDRH